MKAMTLEEAKIIRLGYASRLSAADVCSLINQSRDPGSYILPYTVSYQYGKLKARNVPQHTPGRIIEIIREATPLDTPIPQPDESTEDFA